MKTKIFILIASAFFAGCLQQPSSLPAEKTLSANYGEKPINYESKIKSKINQVLIDPYSSMYEINEPKKGYTMDSYDSTEAFGWVVCGYVNSKNRYGGYTGRAPFFTLFKNNEIFFYKIGEAGNKQYMNYNINNACNR